nr:alpha/beta hydrolase [Clostridium pasteurianum]
MELYAEDMMKFCRNKSLSNIIVIGYSDGANVALAIAHKYPYIAKKMILICGNYNGDGVKWIIKMPILFAKSVVGIVKKFSPNVKFMFWKIKLMVEDYGITESEMRKINTNILILTAKYDFVYRQHQVDMNRYLKNSHMYIVKGTNHFNIITSRKTFNVIKAFINGSK